MQYLKWCSNVVLKKNNHDFHDKTTIRRSCSHSMGKNCRVPRIIPLDTMILLSRKKYWDRYLPRSFCKLLLHNTIYKEGSANSALYIYIPIVAIYRFLVLILLTSPYDHPARKQYSSPSQRNLWIKISHWPWTSTWSHYTPFRITIFSLNGLTSHNKSLYKNWILISNDIIQL